MQESFSYPQVEIVLLSLVAVTVLATVARRIDVPYPVLLVLGGLVIGFVPGLPRIRLDPGLVFLLFLPPLLYVSGLFTSFRDFRAGLRPISLNAFVLVLVTACAVALVAHAAIPGMAWPVAFALGAILSPTDAVAATAVAGRLGVPRRIVTVLEGESLINDATGIVAYRMAAAAVVAGSFSFWEAGLEFVVGSVGGVAVGLAIGWTVARARRYLSQDPSIQNVLSILTPFAAYLPAQELHVSGVLATVIAGLYLGRLAPVVTSSGTRLQGFSTWELVIFLINGLAFVLLGLQLRVILDGLPEYPVPTLVLYGGLVSLTIILVRLLWVFTASYVPRFLIRQLRKERRVPYPDSRRVFIVAWAGMRGVISLAAALSLPLYTYTGAPFPQRDLILFLAYCAILVTLLAQGLSLPALVHALGVGEDDSEGGQEEARARIRTAEAALTRLDELENEEWVREDTAERLRGLHDYRRRRFATRLGEEEDGEEDGYEDRSEAYKRLLTELLQAQRVTLVRLRNEGEIGDDVMHKILRDLDLEESRIEE